MAYSVNWATKVISIPKADLTVIQASPEILELDVVDFWTNIHDIQDDFAGIPNDDIMRSNAPVTISGTTYVRTVEVINGYTVEFEDGQYQVNLVGANNNILDARVQNQVSINPSNSGGAVVAGSGLSEAQATQLIELWKRMGLDADNPLTSTTSQITVDDITIDVTGDGVTTSTATRQ